MVKNKRKAGNPDFKGFVNYPLSDADKAAIKEAPMTASFLDEHLIKVVEAGYSVSAKFDEYNSCFQANLNVVDPKGVNFGYCLTGRGSTPLKALRQVLYIHFHLLDGVWADYTRPAADEIDD